MTSAPVQPFTSELTADELLLLEDAGWEPVALVSGDCGYRVPPPGSSPSSRELTVVSDALTRAQSLALEKLSKQASDAGADGVIGVGFEPLDEGEHGEVWHFAVAGTAVRRVGKHRSERKQPFTSHLSGQDTWALLNAGCAPLSIVFGFSVYHSKRVMRSVRAVCEMPELTEAVYSARENAMRHMQAQAKRHSAHGVVGVTTDMHVTSGPTVRFSVIGTAIATPKSSTADPGPRIAVALRDRPNG